MHLNLYMGTDFYKEPEWMHMDMPKYYRPWTIQKVCGLCGKSIKDKFTYCGLHAKHFKKPEVKILRRYVK